MSGRSAVTACLLTFGATLVSAAALAADSSAAIQIVGVVEENCTIEVSDDGVTLDLAAGASQVAVATVTESCNRADGYVVTVSSSQGGVLRSGATGVAYAVSYGDVPIDLRNGSALRRAGPAVGDARELRLTVPGGDLPAGAYRDTITINIEAR